MTAPLTWPECKALAERNPTCVKPAPSAGPGATTDYVPQARLLGVRAPWRDGWAPAAIAFAGTFIIGVPCLVLMEAIVRGLVFAKAGLQP